jgi:hypothetical protein
MTLSLFQVPSPVPRSFLSVPCLLVCSLSFLLLAFTFYFLACSFHAGFLFVFAFSLYLACLFPFTFGTFFHYFCTVCSAYIRIFDAYSFPLWLFFVFFLFPSNFVIWVPPPPCCFLACMFLPCFASYFLLICSSHVSLSFYICPLLKFPLLAFPSTFLS